MTFEEFAATRLPALLNFAAVLPVTGRSRRTWPRT